MTIIINSINVPEFKNKVIAYCQEKGLDFGVITSDPVEGDNSQSAITIDNDVMAKLSISLIEELSML